MVKCKINFFPVFKNKKETMAVFFAMTTKKHSASLREGIFLFGATNQNDNIDSADKKSLFRCNQQFISICLNCLEHLQYFRN